MHTGLHNCGVCIHVLIVLGGAHSAVYTDIHTVEMKLKSKQKENGTNHHRPLGRQGGRGRR